MVDTTVLANEIRKQISGVEFTHAVLIAVVANLADQFPDMTDAELSAALEEAMKATEAPSPFRDDPID